MRGAESCGWRITILLSLLKKLLPSKLLHPFCIFSINMADKVSFKEDISGILDPSRTDGSHQLEEVDDAGLLSVFLVFPPSLQLVFYYLFVIRCAPSPFLTPPTLRTRALRGATGRPLRTRSVPPAVASDARHCSWEHITHTPPVNRRRL